MTRKSVILKVLPALALAWGASAFWVLASPPMSKPKTPVKTSKSHLVANVAAIKKFITANKRTPYNLNEARLWAAGAGVDFYSYDGFAERFDYVRLSENQYYLRSYGRKGLQNTMLQSPNPSILKWGRRAKTGLAYRYQNHPQKNLYPAAILESADSPNGVWRARLFVDHKTGLRRLIVRDTRNKELFMVAAHDRIEEFMWLSSGYEIIFTATSSERYRDGLYLWNLSSGQRTNLIDALGREGPVTPSDQGLKLFISLAGVDVNGPTVYFYVAENTTGQVNPDSFFSDQKFFGIIAPEDDKKKYRLINFRNANLPSAFSEPISLSKQIAKTNGGLKNQKSWMKLPMKGDFTPVIQKWQEFIERESSRQLMPYGLWHLANFYAQGALAVSQSDKQTSEVLRAYGAEISQSLVRMNSAPSYLRGLGGYLHRQLMSGSPKPSPLGKLTMGKIQVEKPTTEAVPSPEKPSPPAEK